MILVFDFSQENVYVPIHILSALAIGCCMDGSAWPRVTSVGEIFGSKPQSWKVHPVLGRLKKAITVPGYNHFEEVKTHILLTYNLIQKVLLSSLRIAH